MEIDLNADLGEGVGDDDALLEVVTSANVACGFHAGDPLTIRRTCAGAVARGVAIGAQVSYQDRAGFGRRELEVPPEVLHAEVLYQLAAVDGIARSVGGEVSYVKPHGALYHRACRDPEQAEAVVRAVADYRPTLPLLTLPDSVLHEVAARHGVATVVEGFADRAYTPAGGLVPRGEPGAVLHDPAEVVARVLRMAVAQEVVAADGSVLRLGARSICVHGDTPGAVELARAVRKALADAGVTVRTFTRAGA